MSEVPGISFASLGFNGAVGVSVKEGGSGTPLQYSGPHGPPFQCAKGLNGDSDRVLLSVVKTDDVSFADFCWMDVSDTVELQLALATEVVSLAGNWAEADFSGGVSGREESEESAGGKGDGAEKEP